MKRIDTLEVIANTAWRGRQDAIWDYTVRVDGGYRFRARIRLDAYDHQSYGRLDVWGGVVAGWTRIVDLNHTELATLALLKSVTPTGAEDEPYADMVNMVGIALEVL